MKTGNLLSYKDLGNKIKYESSADNEIFLYCKVTVYRVRESFVSAISDFWSWKSTYFFKRNYLLHSKDFYGFTLLNPIVKFTFFIFKEKILKILMYKIINVFNYFKQKQQQKLVWWGCHKTFFYIMEFIMDMIKKEKNKLIWQSCTMHKL